MFLRESIQMDCTVRASLNFKSMAVAFFVAVFVASVNAQGAPKRGGTAVVAVGASATTLNTQLTSNATPVAIADIWADGLFKYDRKGNMVPHLASSWQTSQDGRLITFKLRQNVKWSDGAPFSASDVKFTFDAFAKTNTSFAKVLSNIQRTDAPDAATFVVYLKEPQSAC